MAPFNVRSQYGVPACTQYIGSPFALSIESLLALSAIGSPFALSIGLSMESALAISYFEDFYSFKTTLSIRLHFASIIISQLGFHALGWAASLSGFVSPMHQTLIATGFA